MMEYLFHQYNQDSGEMCDVDFPKHLTNRRFSESNKRKASYVVWDVMPCDGVEVY
jgi:hypothetical protein